MNEIRGTLTEDEQKRWEQIKRDFKRNQSLGGDETDTGMKIVTQLAELAMSVKDLNLTNHVVSLSEAIRLMGEHYNSTAGHEKIANEMNKLSTVLVASTQTDDHMTAATQIATQISHLSEKLEGLKQGDDLSMMGRYIGKQMFDLVKGVGSLQETMQMSNLQNISQRLDALVKGVEALNGRREIRLIKDKN